jgi:hypothetical protein
LSQFLLLPRKPGQPRLPGQPRQKGDPRLPGDPRHFQETQVQASQETQDFLVKTQDTEESQELETQETQDFQERDTQGGQETQENPVSLDSQETQDFQESQDNQETLDVRETQDELLETQEGDSLESPRQTQKSHPRFRPVTAKKTGQPRRQPRLPGQVTQEPGPGDPRFKDEPRLPMGPKTPWRAKRSNRSSIPWRATQTKRSKTSRRAKKA